MFKTVAVGVGIGLMVASNLGFAQNLVTPNDSSTAQPSDPQAIQAIEASILAMGGKAAWKAVGGVTAQVVINSAGLPSRSVNWSDDWSRGEVRFRRDSGDSKAPRSSLVGSDSQHVHLKSDGVVEPRPHDNGIVVLSMGYPAPALILSLSSRYGCTFQSGRSDRLSLQPAVPGADELVVTERCPDHYYPHGAATLTWVFSKASGIPLSVELPIWDQMHQHIGTQTVSFTAFDATRGLPVPSRLTIRRVTGTTDQVAVSNSSFAESLSDETFHLHR